jgi:hypothetical protein
MNSLDRWAFTVPLMLGAAAVCVWTVATALGYK